jgi:hypothetical protein
MAERKAVAECALATQSRRPKPCNPGAPAARHRPAMARAVDTKVRPPGVSRSKPDQTSGANCVHLFAQTPRAGRRMLPAPAVKTRCVSLSHPHSAVEAGQPPVSRASLNWRK